MYTLALRCRDAIKEGTKPYNFRRKVTKEILPSIRKTGSYTSTINTQQQFQIKEAVLNAAQRTGETYQSVYRRFYNHFKIPKYRDLLAKDFDDAMAYLNGCRIESGGRVVDVLTELDRHNLEALCMHFRFVRGWWHRFGKAIGMINSYAEGSIHDDFVDGHTFCSSLIERYKLNVYSINVTAGYPFDKPFEDRVNYLRQYD